MATLWGDGTATTAVGTSPTLLKTSGIQEEKSTDSSFWYSPRALCPKLPDWPPAATATLLADLSVGGKNSSSLNRLPSISEVI